MRSFRFLFLSVVLVVVVLTWQTFEYFQRPLPMTSSRIVTIREGEPLRAMGEELADKEVIPSVAVFIFWGRLLGHQHKIKTGEYEIPLNTTMDGLFSILKSGKSIGYRVTIPEGSNIYEVARLLEEQNLCSAKDFLQFITNKKNVKSFLGYEASSLEGYLFPETYFFTKTDGVKIIVQKMLKHFRDRYKQVVPLPGWNEQQIVTLASIIEKETGAPEERPKISSVFHNRLKKGMRLQTDPTVMYGVQLMTAKPVENITKNDLVTDGPYNTYTRGGLPPGPISNPGLESLQAAVAPESTDFLFFVSKNDGTHVFTAEYKDHSKAVSQFQLNAKAREGRSWRDLKKKKNSKAN